MKKINIDLSQIDESGVAFEFCIPQDAAKQKVVAAIDASIEFYKGVPGRIRCAREQILCIGQHGTREVLLKLTSLDYIERIEPFYGE